jgi:nitrogen fixation protein FixH
MERPVTERTVSSAWRSPWVIAWVIMVVVVLGVNLTMVYLAISTNPGLVVGDYYERGQHYEHSMLSKMKRNPHWVMREDIPKDIRAGERTTVRFFVVDKAGQPVQPDRVTFYAYRPSDASRDFSAPMLEEGNGRYVTEVQFPLKGVWDTLFSVTRGSDEFNEGKRISVERPGS